MTTAGVNAEKESMNAEQRLVTDRAHAAAAKAKAAKEAGASGGSHSTLFEAEASAAEEKARNEAEFVDRKGIQVIRVIQVIQGVLKKETIIYYTNRIYIYFCCCVYGT